MINRTCADISARPAIAMETNNVSIAFALAYALTTGNHSGKQVRPTPIRYQPSCGGNQNCDEIGTARKANGSAA